MRSIWQHPLEAVPVVLKAWAAFIGAVVFGFGFLTLVPPLATGVVDTTATCVAIGAGALLGLWLETRIALVVQESRARAVVVPSEPAPTKALINS